MIRGPKKVVSVTLPMEIYEMVQLMAEDENRSVPVQIRQIIRRYLKSVGLL